MSSPEFPFTWAQCPTEWKEAIRRQLSVEVAKTPDRELTREVIEEAIKEWEPEFEPFTVEDDAFAEFIGAIYLEYQRNGAAT